MVTAIFYFRNCQRRDYILHYTKPFVNSHNRHISMSNPPLNSFPASNIQLSNSRVFFTIPAGLNPPVYANRKLAELGVLYNPHIYRLSFRELIQL